MSKVDAAYPLSCCIHFVFLVWTSGHTSLAIKRVAKLLAGKIFACKDYGTLLPDEHCTSLNDCNKNT